VTLLNCLWKISRTRAQISEAPYRQASFEMEKFREFEKPQPIEFCNSLPRCPRETLPAKANLARERIG
jgi:hypothetical protein